MAISAQTLKNLGKSVAYSSVDVLSKLTPNTSELVRSARNGADNLREFARSHQAKMSTMTAQVDRTKLSRQARSFLNDAWNDIKQGNISLGDLSDQSFGDWEDYMGDISTDSDITSFSSQKIEDEDAGGNGPKYSKQSFGKVPPSGDFRTLEGLQTLGDTMGKTTIKAAQYQTGMITNAIYMQTALQDEHFHTMERQLDSINKNLVELVKFQRDNQAILNSAQLNFFDQISTYIKKQEARNARMASTTNQRRGNKITQFLSGNFFDVNAYKDIVKSNFEGSQMGMLLSMMGILDPSLLGMAMNGPRGKFQPQSLLLNGLINALIPRGAKRSIRQGDSQINTMLKTMLSRLGNMQYDMERHPVLGLLGSILGIDSRANRTMRMGQFKRGEMNWNGEAQKALVQVIPKELAEIKAAILKQDARYYDMQTGSYMTKQDIRRRTSIRMQDATEVPFANIFNSLSLDPNSVKNKKLWQGMSDDLQDRISRIVNEAVMGRGGLTEALANALDEALGEGIKKQGGTKTDTVRMATELTNAINQSRSNIENLIRDLQEQNSAFAQIASDMANQYGMIGFEDLQDFLGTSAVDLRGANRNKYTHTGRRMESMSAEERARYEANMGAVRRVSRKLGGMKNSRNRFVRGVGRLYDMGYNYVTGANEGRYSRRVREASEGVFNAAYDAFQLGKNPFDRRNRQGWATSSRSEADAAENDQGSPESPLSSTSRTRVRNNAQPKVRNDGGRGGGIVNQSMVENSTEARNDPARQTAKATREMNDTTKEAWDPEKGYMGKFFNNPVIQKLLAKLKDSKVGQAVIGAGKKAGNYIKSLFTEDYTDEEGNTVDSVRTRFSKGFQKAKETIASKLGISPNGQVETEDDTTVTGAVSKMAENVNAATETLTGDVGKKKGTSSKTAKSILDSINKVIRKKAPKILTAGAIGGGAALLSGGSLGLLGGMFLPGGPVGGAILGMGLSILSETETFKNVVFGKMDKEGNRQGGLITQKMADGFKKMLPTLGIGAGAGIILKLLTGAIGGPVGAAANVMGFFPSLFLPGGLMGAAIMGSAGAFVLKNEKVQDILFGQKDEDGKRKGTILSNAYNKLTGKIKTETAAKTKGVSLPKKFLNMIKGAAGGVITAGTLGQLGLLGSVFSLGGPVGAAIGGAAVGIAASTQKFQDYLYGEQGEDGKRKKTGLFSRIGKAIELHVVEPFGNYLVSTGQEFMWWAKEKIEVPFRMAFGPIIDSFHNLGTAMADTAKGTIEKTGEAIHEKIDKILSPIGNFFLNKILNPIGKAAGSLIKTSLFAGASVLGAPLQLLSLAVSPKRREGNKLFGNFLRDNREENLQNWWASQEEETGKKVGRVSKMADRFKYGLATSRFGALFRNDEMFSDMAQAFGETDEGKGRNSLNWLGAPADRKRYKKNRKEVAADAKQERKILRLRQQFASRDKYKEDADLSSKEIEKRMRQARKLGINLESADDLRMFTYNYKDWKKSPEERAKEAEQNAPVMKLDQNAQENLQKTSATAEETKGLVSNIKDLLQEALVKMGIIADNSQAQTDILGGETVDTSEIDQGDVAKEIDDEMVDKIQKEQAQENAAAIGALFNNQAKKKAKAENDQRVRGNESGAADDTSMDHDYTNAGEGEEPEIDEDGNVKNADNSAGGGLLSMAGGILKSVFTSKAGLIGLLGAALAAVFSNPELRTLVGNLLGQFGEWAWGKIKEIPGMVADGWNTLMGNDGGINNQRALAFDEEGNVTETVSNTGLSSAVAKAGVANATQGANSVVKAMAKAAKKGKSLNIVQKAGQFLAGTSIPGVKTAGKVIKGVGTVGGAVISGAKKLGNLVSSGVQKLANTSVVQKAVGAVKNVGSSLLEKGKNLGSSLLEKSKNLVSNVASSIKNAVTGAGKAAASGADNVAAAASKSATSNSNIFKKGLELIKSGLEKAGKTKLGSKFSAVISKVASFFDDLIKKVAKSGIADDLVQKLIAALGSAGAKVSSYLVPGLNIINAVVAAGSALSGAINPERLFKIDAKYVDGKMRVIASIINAITSATGLGSVLSVINEIVTELTGNDFIQGFAVTIYHAFADDEDDIKIEEAVSNMEQEVANYNEANGTNLSVDAYNDLKNKGFWGGLWNSAKNLFGAGDKTDYSQYEVGNYKSSKSEGSGIGSKKSGAKNNQLVGYGFGMQNDPAWANMTLGRFPNGNMSTMATGGCGPTALSNAANALGLGFTPPDVANYASDYGYLSEGGANAGLFEEGSSRLSLKSTKVGSSSQILSSLRKGEPVVIAGKDANSAGYGKNPYTAAGHIVTATAADSSGNVMVQDPMRGTATYKAQDLASRMTNAWSYKKNNKAMGYGIIDSLFGTALSTLATGATATLLSKATGVDYETAKSQLAAGSTDTAEDTANNYVGASMVSESDLQGNDQATQIWNYLLSQGYTKEAAAGIMGCWQHESSNRSDRVEGDYLSSFPGFQSVLASNQSLNDYTKNILFPAYQRSGISISERGYKGTDGNYYPGIGLAQWTGPRGYNLFKFAKDNGADWRNLSTQLSFFNSEIQSRGIFNTLNSATSASDGAHLVLDNYEMYKGYGAKAPSALSKRQSAANTIYNTYKNVTPTNTQSGKAEGYGVLDTLMSPYIDQLMSTAYSQFGLDYSAEQNGTTADGMAIGDGTSTGSGIVYPATGNASQDQNNLVKQMASIKGKIKYSLNSPQDPDQGQASCASTVAWAYNKVLGFKPGGSGHASSTQQSKDDKFTTIYSNDGSTLVDLNKLQPGDIVYQNWDRTSNNGTMQHTEMYAGNGQNLSHGGNPTYGPVYKDFGEYRKKHTMMVRRYKGFIDTTGTDTSNQSRGGGFSSGGGASRGGGFTPRGGGGFSGTTNEAVAYGVGPNANAFSVNRVGQHEHRSDMLTGYGTGTSAGAVINTADNRGVESRLDVIIGLMKSLVSKKQTSVGNGPGDLTVNNIKKETKPTVIVNQTSSKDIGAKDAAHEYLRTQHRRIASIQHD